jgi:hypothetical protein
MVVLFFLRMADTVTSQNIDLSSWDMLYEVYNRSLQDNGYCRHIIRVQEKLSLCTSPWIYAGHGGIVVRILILEVSGQLHAPATLPPRKQSPVYLMWKFLRPLSRPGPYREKTNVLPLLGIEPRFLGCPSRCLVVILTNLWFWYRKTFREEQKLRKSRYIAFRFIKQYARL